MQKYAYQENWSEEKLPNLEAENYPNLEKYIPSIDEWMEADQDALLKLLEYPFPVFRYEALSVNKYGFAVIDTNRYGLAPALAGKTVQAKIFWQQLSP